MTIVSGSNPALIDHYEADVVTANDSYPGGMQMPGRKFPSSISKYRYGFNGKENDNEVKGEGNQQDYGMRIYDPRLGKFLSVDPKAQAQSYYSPYVFAGNKPIAAIDYDGLLEIIITVEKVDKLGVITTQTTRMNIVTAEELICGLYRTPVHLFITAKDIEVKTGNMINTVSENNRYSYTGGYDDLESKIKSVNAFEGKTTEIMVKCFEYIGTVKVIEAVEGNTLRGASLDKGTRIASGIEGGEKFVSFVYGGSTLKQFGGGILDEVSDRIVGYMIEEALDKIYRSDEKDVMKDKMKDVLKSVFEIAKKSEGSSKGNLAKMLVSFINGADNLMEMEKAIKFNPGNAVPYSVEAAVNQAVITLDQQGGWDRVEATIPVLSEVIVEGGKNRNAQTNQQNEN